MELNSDYDMCCLFIRVTVNTSFGEEVYMMGSNDELGNW